MSYPISETISCDPLLVANVSYSPDISALPLTTNDDVVWLYVTAANASTTDLFTISGTGWTPVVTSALSNNPKIGLFYCVVASGTVAQPVLTLAAGTAGWIASAWVERDCEVATDPVDSYALSDTASNVTSLTTPTHTPVNDNCRIVYLASSRLSGGQPYIRMHEAEAVGEALVLGVGDNGFGIAQLVASVVQDTKGSTAGKTVWNSQTGRMNIITLAIQNKSGGKRGMSGAAGVSRLLWGGSFAIHDTALTPTLTTTTAPTNPRTINGIAVSATAATRTTDAIGPTIWGLWDNYQTAVSGGWQGTRLPFTADVDMRDKLLSVEFFGDLGSFFDQEGIIIVLEDSTQTNWRAFQVHQRLGWVRNKPYTAIIDLEGDTIYDEGGTFNPQYVRSITPLVHRLPVTTSRGFGMRNWSLLSKSTLTGGNSAVPLNINFLRKLLGGFSLERLVGGDAPAVTVKTDVQIGDGGTTPTYYDATGTLLTFPAPYDPFTQREWQVGTPLNVTIKPGSSDTINTVAGSLVTTTTQNLTMDPAGSTSAAFSAAALVVAGPWVASLQPGFDYAGMTIKGGTINLAAAGTYEFIVAQDTTINFTPTGASTYVMGDCSITGTLDLRNTTAHAITIELPTGTATDDNNNTGGTITVTTPTINITFAGLVAGMQVKAFTTATQTELFSVASSGTSEVWTGAAGTFDYTIMKAGYIVIRGVGEVVSGSRTISATPVADPDYVASSGLTWGTNATADATSSPKQIKVNASTTGRNLHSFLIESWIAQAACKNVAFPEQMDGPNSMILINDWETRGYTTAGTATANTTLDNIKQCGIKYLSAAGALKAAWCSLLSAGVPSGKQVRYAQTDGSGTTNAANTGDINQVIQIYGNASYGNFDKSGLIGSNSYLVAKLQAEGYDQAEANVVSLYGELGAYLYVVGLTPTANGIATGDPALTITISQGTYTEDGKTFSVKLVDNATPSSGTDILRELRYNFAAGGTYQSEDAFNWHDLVQTNGSKFKTVNGTVYGTAITKGVLVYQNDGVTLHPDFTLFTADDGTTYSPPVIADVSITGMPTAAAATTRLQIINQTALSASAWTNGHVYATGDIVKRVAGLGSEQTAGLYFRATTGGTSGALEPTWDTVVGNTTNDNTVVWTCYAILFYHADPVTATLATTYIDGEEFLAGEIAEIRFAEMDEATSFKLYDTTVTVAASGFSVAVAEEAIPEYATFAIDGSTQDSTFSPNFVSDYIVMDADTDFSGKGAFAYYCYTLTTDQGMYEFWGGVTALDAGNIRINASILNLFFDESAGFVKQTDDVRIFRDDGLRPALDPTTGGKGIEINWRVPVNVVTTGGSAVTAQDKTDIIDGVWSRVLPL